MQRNAPMFKPMDSRRPPSIGSMLCLFATFILLHLPRIHSACTEHSIGSPCICLNDLSCDQAFHFPIQSETCACRNGEEVSLVEVARKARDRNGTIGSLHIEGYGIESLDPLIGSLATVTHYLVLQGTSVRSLEPLESLQSVGNITITRNNELTSISGFENLSVVSGQFNIDSNRKLGTISGLNKILRINGKLAIVQNEMLVNISGLSELTRVGSVDIEENRVLQSINGLSKLTHIYGDMSISHNYELIDIAGFRELRVIWGILTILWNNHLPSMKEFGNKLKWIGGIFMSDNRRLNDYGHFKCLRLIFGDVYLLRHSSFNDTLGWPSVTLVAGRIVIRYNSRAMKVVNFNKLSRIVGSVLIKDNSQPFGFTNLAASLLVVDGSLIIESPTSEMLISGFDHLEMVRGDMILASINIHSTSVFQQLKMVGGDMLLTGIDYPSNTFKSLANVQGSVLIEGGTMDKRRVDPPFAVFKTLRRIGGRLAFHGTALKYSDNIHNSFSFFPQLQSLCETSSDAACSLDIDGNSGFKEIKGSEHLSSFDGGLSITRNQDLQTILGFNKLTSLAATRPLSGNFKVLTADIALGALVIGSNPHLKSIEGLGNLEKVEGNLLISGNPSLEQITLENLTRVAGSTQIFENSQKIKNFTTTENLPYSEPGCRDRQNRLEPSALNPEGNTTFVTKLKYNECIVEKIIPTVVGVALIATVSIISLLLLHYMSSRQHSRVVNSQRMTIQVLRSMFGMHVFAIADIFSDAGFVVNAFVVWEGRDPNERDSKLLVIAILSTIVLVGVQIYGAISVYMGLQHKLSGQSKTLLQELRSQKVMRVHDWLLLFPGLLVLEVDVVKHLPWGTLVSVGHNVSGVVHEYLSLVAFRAAMTEDLLQIILQGFSIYVLEGSDGWAITGALASLTLSVTHIIVKLAFSFSTERQESDETRGSMSLMP